MTTLNIIDENSLVIITGTAGPQGPRGVPGPAWPSEAVQIAAEAARDAAVAAQLEAQASQTAASAAVAEVEQASATIQLAVQRAMQGLPGSRSVIASPIQPQFASGEAGIWIQTGLGLDGSGFTIWFEDGQ